MEAHRHVGSDLLMGPDGPESQATTPPYVLTQNTHEHLLCSLLHDLNKSEALGLRVPTVVFLPNNYPNPTLALAGLA